LSFLDRIAACAPPRISRYRTFRVDGNEVGQVKDDFAAVLGNFPDVFSVSGDGIELAPDLNGFEQRTKAVDRVLRALAERQVIRGWREEKYPVATSFKSPALFHMERAAVALFGVRAYGVHMNGFTGAGTGMKMWIGRRGLDRMLAPGKLDQIVAGGQPAGLSLRQNLIKESAEEASIPAELAGKAIAVGGTSYCMERPEGLRRDLLFNFDLELPADFEPVNNDGEISEFYLWPIEQVIETVRDTDEFKFNCSLVVIDFLIRHGFIEPDHADYVELVRGLHG
jgi:hypothetical protein